MAQTLFHAVYQLAAKLQILLEGRQTGSSSQTVIEDSLFLTQGDDYWNGGTVFAVDTQGAAPERQFAIVTDFADTNNRITHQGFTVSLANGAPYAVAKPLFPLPLMIQKINTVLRRLGEVEWMWIGGLVTAENTREYAVDVDGPGPSEIREVTGVWMQGQDSSDSDVGTVAFREYLWQALQGWEVWREGPLNQSSDVALRLVFPYALPSGRYLALRCLGLHPMVSSYGQVLYLPVPLERVVIEAAVECLEWYQYRHKGGDKTLEQLLGLYRQEAQMLAQRYPLRQKASVKLAEIGMEDWGWDREWWG